MKPLHLRERHEPAVQLNLNVRGLGVSATIRINERSKELARAGRKVFRMGLGQSPFPVPKVVVQALRRNAFQKDYLPPKGLPELRDVVARDHSREFGVPCGEGDVLIGPGSKELMFLMQLVYYGDLVIPTPSWVSYSPQARIIGRQVRFLNTERSADWTLKAQQLEALCLEDPGRPRIVILNYPSNPTGGTYTQGELEDLARVARRYRVILLSDEIYGRLHHRGRHRSILPFYPEGTVLSTGLSKWCGAGGWRLGLFVFPEPLRWLADAMTSVASETFTATSAPIQYAAVRAFQGGPEIEAYLQQARRVLRALGRHVCRRLREVGADVNLPEGGFYLFPDFSGRRKELKARGIRDGLDLCEMLLEETGVALLPGSAFGRPEHELNARLAYVDFDGKKALKAAAAAPRGELGVGFLRRHCARMMEGTERLCRWISR